MLSDIGGKCFIDQMKNPKPPIKRRRSTEKEKKGENTRIIENLQVIFIEIGNPIFIGKNWNIS